VRQHVTSRRDQRDAVTPDRVAHRQILRQDGMRFFEHTLCDVMGEGSFRL